MNLGAFMNPEFPIFSTTLCYLERDDAYLMLHRIKKQDDYNHDKWIGVGGKFERFEYVPLLLLFLLLLHVFEVLLLICLLSLGYFHEEIFLYGLLYLLNHMDKV